MTCQRARFHGAFRRLAARALAAAVLSAVVACSHGPQTQAPQVETSAARAAGEGDLVACCRDVERVPGWIVTLADPAAPLIGRAIGSVVWRRGHLAGTPAQARVAARLRPLDIVLVSNKGRLSNHTLPGLLSHAAVYLGTEGELRGAGAWHDPAVAKHHRAIRAGRIFIEADQDGVHLSGADSVLDVDRLAVLRPRLDGAARRRRAIDDYFGRVGGAFDFHFDVASDDCTFCTELIHRTLPELGLPVRRAYGRELILPDELARLAATGSSRLSLVLYVRGNRSGWETAGAKALAADLAAEWGNGTPARPGPGRARPRAPEGAAGQGAAARR